MEVGRRGKSGRLLRWVCGLVVAVPLAGLAMEAGCGALDQARHPPPGRMVDVQGSAQHLLCKGTGDTVVVLVAGVGGSCLQWSRVQSMLERHVRVCSYDRAGLGWSQPLSGPRTADRLADELAQLLSAGGIQGKVVLVGQSYGGQVALQMASRHPKRVGGLVLVDAVGPGSFPPLSPGEEREESRRLLSAGRRLAWLARLGLVRMASLFAGGSQGRAGAIPSAEAVLRIRPARIETVYREKAALRASIDMTPARLPSSLPVTVISAYRDLPAGDARREAQERLARIAPESRHVITYRSGHNIHLEEPDLVVREVMAMVRKRRAAAGIGGKEQADGKAMDILRWHRQT